MGLFNEDGRLRDPEALRSIYLGPSPRHTPRQWVDGDTKKAELLREDSGELAAVTTEHADGHVDAQVFMKPVALRAGRDT